MTLDRIWAGWRSAYVTSVPQADQADEAEDGCLFCTLAATDDEEALVVERTPLTFTVMNAFPYTPGHLMVAPLRHEGEFEDLSAEEGAELFAALQRAVRALKAVSRPHGLNLGVNIGRVAGAGVPGHVHVHALPRWNGDSNFMTTVAEARVLSEDLRTTWKKLREAWLPPPGTPRTPPLPAPPRTPPLPGTPRTPATPAPPRTPPLPGTPRTPATPTPWPPGP